MENDTLLLGGANTIVAKRLKKKMDLFTQAY